MHRAATKLTGPYTVWVYCDRDLAPRPGDSITFITARPIWSRNPNILDVIGRDLREGRNHRSYISLDPDCPTRATRTIIYDDTGETTQQRIDIISEGRMKIFQTESSYDNHELRLSPGMLPLN